MTTCGTGKPGLPQRALPLEIDDQVALVTADFIDQVFHKQQVMQLTADIRIEGLLFPGADTRLVVRQVQVCTQVTAAVKIQRGIGCQPLVIQ